MSGLLEVTLPEYYKCAVKPRGFAEFCDMFEAQGKPLGLWELVSWDARTGDIVKRLWTKNVVTDNGATAMLKNAFNNAGSAISIFNQVAVAANAGSTTLTTALSSGVSSGTTLSVAAIPAQITSGTQVQVGYGSGTTQNFTLTATAAAGATSLTITAQTANATYGIGTNVVPIPTTSDNPSSSAGAQYSGALASGAFTFSGTGAGARQVIIAYTFTAGSFTAGNYTEAFMTNANPIVAGSTATHLITTPMALNNTTSLTVNITEKI